jgi:hypothetical protein
VKLAVDMENDAKDSNRFLDSVVSSLCVDVMDAVIDFINMFSTAAVNTHTHFSYLYAQYIAYTVH